MQGEGPLEPCILGRNRDSLLPTSQKALEGEVHVQTVHKMISGHRPGSELLPCQEYGGTALFTSWPLRIPYSLAISLIGSRPIPRFFLVLAEGSKERVPVLTSSVLPCRCFLLRTTGWTNFYTCPCAFCPIISCNPFLEYENDVTEAGHLRELDWRSSGTGGISRVLAGCQCRCSARRVPCTSSENPAAPTIKTGWRVISTKLVEIETVSGRKILSFFWKSGIPQSCSYI